MAYQSEDPDENRFKLGQVVLDYHAYRVMIYIGCSNVARGSDSPLTMGSYKFLIKAKNRNSYYMGYLSPSYVNQNVKARDQTTTQNGPVNTGCDYCKREHRVFANGVATGAINVSNDEIGQRGFKFCPFCGRDLIIKYK